MGTHDRRAARSRGPAEREAQAQRAEGHGQVSRPERQSRAPSPGLWGSQPASPRPWLGRCHPGKGVLEPHELCPLPGP